MTKCSNCETENTPMWRRFLDTEQGCFTTLCNACGLYYKSKGSHRPKLLITKKSQISKYEQLMNRLANEAEEEDSVTKVLQFKDEELTDVTIISCANCKCINTSLWRKDGEGNNLCNACGLYHKKNGVHRPVKKDGKDLFIEIDSNVIRFNKIKRRKRSVSDHHNTHPKIQLQERKKSTSGSPISPHESSGYAGLPSYSSSSYVTTPTSADSSPHMNYKLVSDHPMLPSSSTSPLPPSAALLLPTPHFRGNETYDLGQSQLTITPVLDRAEHRLPPISVLFNSIDTRTSVSHGFTR